MFGYVLPSRSKLTEEELKDFESMYCGLCRTLKRRYGLTASFILNYDLTFLAILLSDGETPKTSCQRCIAHPCKGRCMAEDTAALDYAAACSVILAYWQLRDGAADSRGVKGLSYRFAARLLRRAYHQAAAEVPAFDRHTRQQLQRLAELEQAGCTTLDEPADAFAALLAGAADDLEPLSRRRIFHELFYHLGRWIYLVDAADDLKKDFKNGNYNPLVPRYELSEGKLDDESRAAFSLTLDHSVRQVAAAFELWEFGCWSNLLRSTFYEGLYQVGGAVLEGSFRRRKNRKKSTNAEDIV